MEKKTVLLDLGELNNPTSGFGQIVNNYARIYSAMEDDELRFHFLLPRGYKSDFGPNVDCTSDWKKNGKGIHQRFKNNNITLNRFFNYIAN